MLCSVEAYGNVGAARYSDGVCESGLCYAVHCIRFGAMVLQIRSESILLQAGLKPDSYEMVDTSQLHPAEMLSMYFILPPNECAYYRQELQRSPSSVGVDLE